MSWICYNLAWQARPDTMPDEETIATLVEVFDHAGYGVHNDNTAENPCWMACFDLTNVPENVVATWQQMATQMELPAFTVSEPYPVEKTNWNESWKEFFQPQIIGNTLAVVPAWNHEAAADLKSQGRSVILIEPGMAFGTGTHETTKLCMATLEQHLKPVDKVLDAGTGSGILVIAALKCGCSHATGFDIDPDVEENFELNCKINDIAKPSVSLMIGSIADLPPGAYDMVVCNMLSREFLPILPDLKARMAPEDSRLILSGLLGTEEAEVEKAVRAEKLEVTHRLQDGEWSAFVCRRASV